MKTRLLLAFAFCSFNLFSQTNLVPNGDFEDWTSYSQPQKWYRYLSGLVSQSTSAQSGTSSTNMEITNGTFNVINSEFFPVVANKTYRITLYHKLVSGSFSAIDFSLYHEPGVFKEQIIKQTDATFSSSEWRKIEFDYTPTVSENIEVDIWITGTLNSEILVDNVSVIDVSEYTLIPDVNFEKKLIALGIDSGATDGKVLTNSVNKLTSLDIWNSSISDLTGIHDFVALNSLNCSYNPLTNLDVSKNVALTSLTCYSNRLTSLDVSKNLALIYLDCSGNQLTSLDISKNMTIIQLSCYYNQLTSLDVSKNVALTSLNCYSNQLTSLDVSKNLALIYLTCFFNKLTSLDVSKNLALEDLGCNSNKLTSLDVSKNVALEDLDCNSNKLTSLDVSKNVALEKLDCSGNLLTSLDVSKNVALSSFYCHSNKLFSLNLKNGKNTLLTNGNIYLTGNPDLICITVDATAYANTNWANRKDNTAIFSSYDCSTVTKIPDGKFEDKLIEFGIDTDGKNGFVLNSSIAAITSLDVSNSAISDLTGIQGFTALTTLNCSNNVLKKIDLSKNASFSTLNCSQNTDLWCIQVADIEYATTHWSTIKDAKAAFNLDCTDYTLIPDVKFEEKLIALGIDKDGKNGKVATKSIMSLTSLDVSSSSITDLTGIQDFVALKILYCYSNKLTSLDVSKNVALDWLYCFYNQLTALDVSKNVALNRLDCSRNQLTGLDISKNVALDWLDCSSNKLNNLDSNNPVLDRLDCSYNQLTSLDISKNLDLSSLYCYSNKLTYLDVSKNVALTRLDCYFNQLTSLDVSKNTNLSSLSCFQNKLLSLNLKNGKNTLLTDISLTGNTNLTCIIVDDVAYANTNWANRKDNTAIFSPYDCSTVTKIPDVKFEDKLIALGIDTDGKNGVVLNSSIGTITSLDVSNSTISDLTGIQGFTALTTLNCSNNVLKKVDLSKNTTFSTLNCSQNADLWCIQVTDVDYASTHWSTIKDSKATFNLDCTDYTLIPDAKFEEKLIALGIDSGATDGKVLTNSINILTTLNVSYSSITDLTGIQDFTSLKILNCCNNLLTSLDVSKNIVLEALDCSYNQITTLDVSKNVALTSLFCNSNKLLSLNLKNSKNNLMSTSIRLFNNRSLSCILVDNLTYSNTHWANKKDDTAFYSSYDCASISQLPDENFEDKLIALGIDTDGKNGFVLNSSIAAITSLDVSNSAISDLTGIQGFTALTTLNCSNNVLKKIDLSKNASFATLNCSQNTDLGCIQVTDVDYATAHWSTTKDAKAAFNLDCTDYTLIPDVKFEEKLIALGIDKDGKNGKITTKSIIYITDLNVSRSSITNLTGIQDFTSLTNLKCSSNQLTSLDLSNNKALRQFDCSSNKLLSLNLKNGKNTLMDNPYISFGWNPNLYCIMVDDIAYSNANWADKKNVGATYNSTECNFLILPSDNFAIETKGESCSNEKNGEINITATATYPYIAIINGKFYSFYNNRLKVHDFAPGTYNVSIYITGETFEQNFIVVIAEATTINGKSSVVNNKVTVEITQGTAPFTVFVNGREQFETLNPSFTVDAQKGGVLEVKTAKACEGSYTKDIGALENAVSVYPNPTSGSFEIQLFTAKKEVEITLYTLAGQLISNKNYTIENGKAKLTLENQPAGVYMAKIALDSSNYLKIIKQ